MKLKPFDRIRAGMKLLAAATFGLTAMNARADGSAADLDRDSVPNIVDPDLHNDGMPNTLDENIDGDGRKDTAPAARGMDGDGRHDDDPVEDDIDGDSLDDDDLSEEDIDGDNSSDSLDSDIDRVPRGSLAMVQYPERFRGELGFETAPDPPMLISLPAAAMQMPSLVSS